MAMLAGLSGCGIIDMIYLPPAEDTAQEIFEAANDAMADKNYVRVTLFGERDESVLLQAVMPEGVYTTVSGLVQAWAGELAVAKDESLLVVARSRLLAAVPWITLIEIAPGRHLLSLRDGATIEKLEVTLGDLLDSNPDASQAERNVLRTLLSRIRAPRRNHAVRKEEILFVRTVSRRRPAR